MTRISDFNSANILKLFSSLHFFILIYIYFFYVSYYRSVTISYNAAWRQSRKSFHGHYEVTWHRVRAATGVTQQVIKCRYYDFILPRIDYLFHIYPRLEITSPDYNIISRWSILTRNAMSLLGYYLESQLSATFSLTHELRLFPYMEKNMMQKLWGTTKYSLSISRRH